MTVPPGLPEADRPPEPGPDPVLGGARPPSAAAGGVAARRGWAPWAGAGVVLAKWGAVLLKAKALLSLGSLLVSVAAYAQLYGWPFGVGFVLLIAVHELGHVVALRRLGIAAGLPVFLPFIGAFVRLREAPRSVLHEAQSALAGPAAGAAGALVLAVAAALLDSGLLRALAFSGFLLNLFNLVPALPLDGGRAAAALHPAVWGIGLAGLLVYEVVSPRPLVLLLLLLSLAATVHRWRARHRPAARAYDALTRSQRVGVAAGYLGLVLATAVAASLTYVPRSFGG